MEDGTQGTKPSSSSSKQKPAMGIQDLQSNTQNDESDESDPASAQAPPTHKHCWTMTHGFYAVMGGFAIDTSSEGPSFVNGRQGRLTFTVEGLRFIALNNQNLLPDIPEREIQDRSKANGLAKFLVCTQALWFCIQCISRTAQGLPISLLEINTAAHAICTLLIYLLWWSKPLDVEEPTLLKGPMSWTLAAWMWMTGLETEEEYWTPFETDITIEDPIVSGQRPSEVDLNFNHETFLTGPRRSQPDNQDSMTLQPSFTPNESAETASTNESAETASTNENAETASTTQMLDYGVQLIDILRYQRFYNSNDIRNLRSPVMVYSKWHEPDRGRYPRTRSLGWYWSGGRTMNFLRLGKMKWQPRIGSVMEFVKTPEVVHVNWTGVKLYESVAIQIQQQPGFISDQVQGIVRRSLNWPLTRTDFTYIPKKQHMIALFLSGFLYGGFHALAWDYYFASEIQRRLWQVSAVTIMAAAPIGFFGASPTLKLSCWLEGTIMGYSSDMNVHPSIFLLITSGLVRIPLFLAQILYLAGRVYLVVESFMSVMNLPEAIYELPVWSAYFPHIS
ncbi:hypothetical protein MMC17_006071 [Xylographa soralifera]|nr:hypothetical protein [Xylographa soralifera]